MLPREFPRFLPGYTGDFLVDKRGYPVEWRKVSHAELTGLIIDFPSAFLGVSDTDVEFTETEPRSEFGYTSRSRDVFVVSRSGSVSLSFHRIPDRITLSGDPYWYGEEW